MRLSIKYKIFLAILSAHVVVYAAMYSIGRYNFDKGFLEYVSRIEERQVPALIEGLANFYKHTGSWDTLRKNPRKWVELVFESIESTYDPDVERLMARRDARPLPRGAQFSPNDWYYSSDYTPARPYLLLLDADQKIIFGDETALPLANLHPINARGATVGYLAVTSRQQLSEQADMLFAQQQRKSFLIIAAVLVLVSAIVVAFPVSSVLVKPIREMVGGTHALTSGDYSSRIKVRGSDEVALLSKNFNTLAATLEQNRAARQQWIADISHELRTPLAILRGELESLQDGVRPLTPESLDSLHHEVVHLNTLVNDLHELSMSDVGALVYEKTELDIVDVLEQCIESHEQLLSKHGIELIKHVKPLHPGRKITVHGDDSRIYQLFANLMQNTCRYTNDGGKLVINLQETPDSVMMEWLDSEPGVSDNALDHLFDRLYRVDASRNRRDGGSGLGLAICRNIVEAHDGTITAGHSPLGGLKLTLTFPRFRNNMA